jgi:hypothetical protein
MARPVKSGLDYFSMDCNFNSKFKIFIAKYGNEGLGIWLRITQHIYFNKGYYMKYDEDNLLVLSDELRISYEFLEEILMYLLDKEIFDKTMFEEQKIITSERIQENFVEATKRRNSNKMELMYTINKVNVNNNLVNADIMHTSCKQDVNKKYTNKITLNNIKENKTKSNKNKTNEIKEYYINSLDTLVVDIFEEFLNVRKNLKCKETKRTIDLLVNELLKYDIQTQIKMIENSIVNNWKSVYALKNDGKPKTNYIEPVFDEVKVEDNNIDINDVLKNIYSAEF